MRAVRAVRSVRAVRLEWRVTVKAGATRGQDVCPGTQEVMSSELPLTTADWTLSTLQEWRWLGVLLVQVLGNWDCL